MLSWQCALLYECRISSLKSGVFGKERTRQDLGGRLEDAEHRSPPRPQVLHASLDHLL